MYCYNMWDYLFTFNCNTEVSFLRFNRIWKYPKTILMNKPLTWTIIFVAFLPYFTSAQCTSGNCSNGSGTKLYASGSKYVGQFLNGQRSGIGSLYYADGTKYQGEWLKDKPDGEGVETLPDGSKREGIWQGGRLIKKIEKNDLVDKGIEERQTGCISGDCKNGKGIYIYHSGAIYIGDFQSGEVHGYGSCHYPDGSTYQGQWIHRYPDGRGTKTFKDGTKRSGYWKKGQPVDEYGNFVEDFIVAEGYTAAATEIQTGCISGDCLNGQGIYAYTDGSRYDGFFRNGKPALSGTFHHPNGDKYVGAFVDGMRHGKGRMYFTNGQILEGKWINGEYEGSVEKPNKSKQGCVSGDCQEGDGTYFFKDGTKYLGQFRNGLPHGQGKVEYLNGEIYEGEMAEGQFDGYGTLRLVNGTEVVGYWSKGTYISTKPKLHETQVEDSHLKTFTLNPDVEVWAVVVGVAGYDHMPVLKYTDDDAYRMYAFFKSPEGGALDDDHISILVDEAATKENILATMTNVFHKAGENDLVIMYFSGHGLKDSFLPIDFDGFNQKILHSEINQIFAQSQAKYKLCIADACHSGSILAMRGDKIPDALRTYYSTLAQADRGSALLMSSKSDETSLESSGLRQGVFSHFLIRGLTGESDSNNDKVVTIQELYDFIYFNVRAYTGKRQSPIMMGDYDQDMTIAVRR